ncbi:formamidopyrimidine-DNA glycosylase [Terrihabitans soli]|uniref:Formamidopyrimidine-DNA glycosylase n=1 Tax=Terrihabitans soli TaxID=708113 RepID=A0A6S6QTK8_9HYPH|nr:bifunctional DNA-formamidopyrimidine glycosylase/DNA-(apurinic or apyrimidinic site) lyase [Terrihabitans soli]BCJ92429.1 formamidopyrimidine-DNA glycosylase [Terrihabitans soli]
MPELPEVETVRRGLEPALLGAKLVKAEARRKDLRFPFPPAFAEKLTGRTITALTRRAKYLLADLDDGQVLIAHLGMSGSFRVEDEVPGAFHRERSRLAAHDHVVLTTDRNVTVTYNDPRRFGFMLLVPRSELDSHPLIKDLGIEPLGNELSGEYLLSVFTKRSAPLKAALLDQKTIAGLGNIYVCEALFRAGLSPKRTARTLRLAAAERLAEAIRAVLQEAVEAGGSSLRDHAQTNGELGYFQHRFAVYDRAGEPCPREGCKGTVRRIVQSGRSTFYCPACQK